MAVYSNIGSNSTTENFLEGCQPVDVIPGYSSISEMAFHVIEATESNFNSLMMECGVKELTYFEENHQEMIYESSDKDGIISKAINFFKHMWERVQGLIKKAIEAFEKKAKEFREKVFKKLDKKFLKKRVDNLDAKKSFGTTYEYADINKRSSLVIKYIKSADESIDDLFASVSAAKNGETDSVDNLENKIKVVVDDCIKKVSVNKATNLTGIVDCLKDTIRGENKEYTGADIKRDWETIIKEMTDYPETKRILKNDYKELQKTFNDAIKSCKKVNNGKMFEANAFTKCIKAYKDLRKIAVYSQQAIISCLHEKQAFYRKVLFKVIGTKPVKESVSEASTIDGISSLFDWD